MELTIPTGLGMSYRVERADDHLAGWERASPVGCLAGNRLGTRLLTLERKENRMCFA